MSNYHLRNLDQHEFGKITKTEPLNLKEDFD